MQIYGICANAFAIANVVMDLFGLPLSLLMGFVCFFILMFVCLFAFRLLRFKVEMIWNIRSIVEMFSKTFCVAVAFCPFCKMIWFLRIRSFVRFWCSFSTIFAYSFEPIASLI